ncbi:hypothetical protein HAL1_03672 [Halomonas sp. HAL1]|nr:hypothetical protein HAL1_03672 [Halomonas sp. HAL1]
MVGDRISHIVIPASMAAIDEKNMAVGMVHTIQDMVRSPQVRPRAKPLAIWLRTK